MGVLLVGLVASCDGLLNPEQPLEPGDPSLARGADPGEMPMPLELAPAGPIEMMVRDTLRLELLMPLAEVEVEFESSNRSVASVSESGVIGAIRPGQAVITARAEGRPARVGSVTVNVHSRGPAAITIGPLRLPGADVPVNRVAAAGEVEVHLDVLAGDAARVEVLVDSLVACTRELPRYQTGTSAGADVSLQLGCTVDTAAYDELTGTPRFHNGSVSLAARLLSTDDRVLASVEGPELILANESLVMVRVEGEREAVDAAGRRWLGGHLTVTPVPVLYDRELRLDRRFVAYADRHDRRVEVHTESGAQALLIEADDLSGVVRDSMRVEVGTMTSTGLHGPGGRSAPFRYDAAPPRRGTLAAREWIGADFDLQTLFTPAPEPDPGVGRLDLRFYAGSPGESAEQIVGSGTRVRRGADLEQAPPGSYQLAAQVCDLLENCYVQEGFSFGVDLEPPTISMPNLPHRAVNPGIDLVVSASDGVSGLGPQPLEVSVDALGPGMSQRLCGPTVEGVRLPGTFRNGACEADPAGTSLFVPRSTTGYYRYRLEAVDRAGNRSVLREATILIDGKPPTVHSLTMPAQLAPGSDALVQAHVSDDLDLADVVFRLGYARPGGGRLALPFAPAVAAGTPFGDTLTPAATVTARLPFVRTLTHPATASSARTTVLVDSLHVEALDAAGNPGRRSAAIPPARYGGNTSVRDPFPSVASTTLATNRQRVCISGCQNTDPTVATMTVRLVGGSGFTPPSRVFVFGQSATAGVHLLATSGNFSISDTGTQRTVTYTLSVTPPSWLDGDVSVFGVAVNSAGNGLVSNPVEVELYRR